MQTVGGNCEIPGSRDRACERLRLESAEHQFLLSDPTPTCSPQMAMTSYSVSFLLFLSLALLCDANRTLHVDRRRARMISVGNGGKWGTWRFVDRCPFGSKAKGFMLKVGFLILILIMNQAFLERYRFRAYLKVRSIVPGS